MKTRLLRRLRKQAKKEIRVYYYPFLNRVDIEFYRRDLNPERWSHYRTYYDGENFQKDRMELYHQKIYGKMMRYRLKREGKRVLIWP